MSLRTAVAISGDGCKAISCNTNDNVALVWDAHGADETRKDCGQPQLQRVERLHSADPHAGPRLGAVGIEDTVQIARLLTRLAVIEAKLDFGAAQRY